jgi:DNA-binding transcriptional ArsR family regulator
MPHERSKNSYNRSTKSYIKITPVLLDLLFGSYRQRALTQLLLHPDSSYHVRELARLTGTTPGTLHKELARLAQAGLLLREAQGNQVRYRANRDCPVFAELAGLFRKTSGVVGVLAGPCARSIRHPNWRWCSARWRAAKRTSAATSTCC